MTAPTGPADAARGLPGEGSDTGDPPVRTPGPGAFAVLPRCPTSVPSPVGGRLGATALGWFVGRTGYSGAILGMGIVIGVVSATVTVIGRFCGRGSDRGMSAAGSAPAGKGPEQIHTATR